MKYYTEYSPTVLQNFQDVDEKRIRCIKNFVVKSVQVEREVIPIILQCLDGMAKCADSIDEKEVKNWIHSKLQHLVLSFGRSNL